MTKKEQIISEMRSVMPFYLHPNFEPYIMEAMDVYAKHYHAVELSKLKELLPDERGDGLHELSQYGRGKREGFNDCLSLVNELLTIKECNHEYISGTQSNGCDVSVCRHCGDIS